MKKAELTSMLLYQKRKSDSPLCTSTTELQQQWNYRKHRLHYNPIPAVLDDGDPDSHYHSIKTDENESSDLFFG